MQELAEIFDKLRVGFDQCMGKKCTYDQTWCNKFWAAIFPKLEGLRGSCNARGAWPAHCTQLLVDQNIFRKSTSFELQTMCSLIQPGGALKAGRPMQPQRRNVALSMVRYQTTLADCSQMARDQCINHFCALNNEFRYRIRPRQLQQTLFWVNSSTYYPAELVLPGCETVAAEPYDEEECPIREDIIGMCDCLCTGWKDMPPSPAGFGCSANIDSFLMFGRLGVEGIKLSQGCEDPFCSLLSSSRLKCPGLKLPDQVQCKALAVPTSVLEACPWQKDSGEDGVLECLDGHRCRPDAESWACCFAHEGRGRCPKDTPHMCNTLCSGSATEYCCEDDPLNCAPRECSPLLVPDHITVPPITTLLTTTVPGRLRAGEDGGGLSLRLPEGSWVWLILIVPFFLGLFCVYLWHRAYKAAQWVDITIEGAKSDAEQIFDKDGPFHICRKPDVPSELVGIKTIRVKIEVDDLPLTKPLGLELLETKVNRVHPQASKYGWQPCDVIVQVGHVPVSTFAEIWARIQVERDRLPCIFTVERQAIATSYLDVRGQKNSEAIERAAASSKPSGTASSKGESGSNLHKEASSKLLEGMGASRQVTDSSRPGSPSLRDAALIAAEEGSEDYANFEQPTGQEWRAEYNAREEINRQMVTKKGRNLQDPHRVMENLRTIEITSGITRGITQDDMRKVMSQFGQVEHCHMGTRDQDGQFISFPYVRFQTKMAAEAAMTALREGDFEMEDKTKHGLERVCKLKGERKQDHLWSVPGQIQGSSPRGLQQVPHEEGNEQPQDRAFGQWWTEPSDQREETPEEFYSSVEGWQQWQLDQAEEGRKPTLWEEARAIDHTFEKAFNETVPYHAWLDDAKAHHPEEVGDAKEWVCSVCKRGNKLVETHCRVCHSEREYRNDILDSAARPRVLLPTGGIQKVPDARVVFKKDAWGRGIYGMKP